MARDRSIAYRNAHRFAVNGGLVVFDRFPVPQIKLMDGPKIETLAGTAEPNRLLRRMIDLERRYFSEPSLRRISASMVDFASGECDC